MSSSTSSDIPDEGSAEEKLPQHHVSVILDEALEDSALEEAKPKRFKHHPMLIDMILGLGLLIAVGGFSVGLLRMYIAHSAGVAVAKGDYKIAIGLIDGAPFPDLFAPPGSEPREILDQALYRDAIQALDRYYDDQEAIRELGKIEPGSKFFALAQTIIDEHFKPAPITVAGEVVKVEHLTEKEREARSKQLPEQPRYEDEPGLK
jgi:hypothetical protein